MSSRLGTLDELPTDYLEDLSAMSVTPLWPNLHALLPRGIPERKTRPYLWSYEQVRPYLMRAGELTPMEKAERRVLVLSNPGLGLENLLATPSIYIGLQLILPGETAPCHRHTPSAVRFVIEGEGGYTTVEDEKCIMNKGDLILTPAGSWHDHGNSGAGPVVWLDALDLMLIYGLEASYAVEGPIQESSNMADASQTRYRRAGLVPYPSLAAPRPAYPLVRYPWDEVRTALADLATGQAPDEAVRLAYVNPETGAECIPTLGFSAQMLRPGEETHPPRRSASSAVHVIEGEGQSEIDGETLAWGESDTLAVPTHARVIHRNGSPDKAAYLFHVDDAPLQRKIGIYEEFPDA